MDIEEPLIEEENKPKSTRRVSRKVATPKTEVKRRSAKKKSRKGKAKREVTESALMAAPGQPPPPQKASKGTTWITSLWPGKLKVPNTPSGAVYGWPQAGARTEVADEDVAFVMSKNRNADRGCCGSNVRIYFSLGN